MTFSFVSLLYLLVESIRCLFDSQKCIEKSGPHSASAEYNISSKLQNTSSLPTHTHKFQQGALVFILLTSSSSSHFFLPAPMSHSKDLQEAERAGREAGRKECLDFLRKEDEDLSRKLEAWLVERGSEGNQLRDMVSGERKQRIR